MYTKEEAKALRIEFWEKFGHYSKGVLRKYGKKNWIKYNTKVKGVEFKFFAGRQNAEVIIEINNNDENKRLENFEKLNSFKSFFENKFDSLVWELVYIREAGNEVSRIYTELKYVDIHRKEQWGEIFRFLTENMLKFEDVWVEIKDVFDEE